MLQTELCLPQTGKSEPRPTVRLCVQETLQEMVKAGTGSLEGGALSSVMYKVILTASRIT